MSIEARISTSSSAIQRPGTRRNLPVSTYRLQLRPDFTFRDAARIIEYLNRLGITDLYLSPWFASAPDSEHGYDVTDHNLISPSLGGEEAHEMLLRAAEAHGMGQVLDFVPNHMGVGHPRANAWWWDVLENGECSPYAGYFDIDWRPVKDELHDRVLLPVLGDQYGRVLERGELKLDLSDGGLVLRYYETEFPINPRKVPDVLRPNLGTLEATLGVDDPSIREFMSVLTALENLPSRLETNPRRIAERQREKEIARARLARLLEAAPPIRAYVEEQIRRCNGVPGEPGSFDALHALLEVQAYRLAYWRTAFHEINYRRFFDVNGLASLRVEDPEVFETIHRVVLRLIEAHPRTGIRIDHLDGLLDPGRYLSELSRAAAAARGTDEDGSERPVYLVVEKILSSQETLPQEWLLHGTTGYDFMSDLNGVFVDPVGLGALHRFYRRFTRRQGAFGEVVYESKKSVLESTLASELNMLAHQLNTVSEGDRRSRDFTLLSLRSMLTEVISCFPVYRTYVTRDGHRGEDEAVVLDTVARARRRNPALDPSILEFFADVMLDRYPADLPETERAARREFAMKFQQYTGPAQAKGVEDTAFYRHGVLLSLNEVGGAPDRPSLSPKAFHERNESRRQRWPHGMLATSTHDTKRGEDTRARLNVLTEHAGAWTDEVPKWAAINAVNRTRVEGEWAPDRGDEYFFYQTLVGIWPNGATDPTLVTDRIRSYMTKAIREAKLHTGWVNENAPYERAVDDFVTRSLTGRTSPAFFARFLPFMERLERPGIVNALAQVVLKIASPGVADFYQGTETWTLTLVDPDNRRKVDFDARSSALSRIDAVLDAAREPQDRRREAAALLESYRDGAVKMLVTAAGLRLRHELPGVFQEGMYVPLATGGTRAEHVVALARRHGSDIIVAVVPRLANAPWSDAFPLGTGVWLDTCVHLPEPLDRVTFEDVATGARHGAPALQHGPGLAVGALLDVLPVCILRARAV